MLVHWSNENRDVGFYDAYLYIVCILYVFYIPGTCSLVLVFRFIILHRYLMQTYGTATRYEQGAD